MHSKVDWGRSNAGRRLGEVLSQHFVESFKATETSSAESDVWSVNTCVGSNTVVKERLAALLEQMELDHGNSIRGTRS
jgi:hypothetical protein